MVVALLPGTVIAATGELAVAPVHWDAIGISFSHMTRWLTVTDVPCGLNATQCGANLVAALTNAVDGDELKLGDGTYTGSGDTLLTINKNITIRAQHVGQAVLDGKDARRVIQIVNGMVILEGLNITRGNTASVSACH